ncbi:MAG: hypothetical protein DI539_20975 [Flavobacterium psychrophilum]|jgi:transmembrane sensor|nr:MAG: hypothetical protein DI539_20975 [Flavobacterium psychrophilum]
MDTSPINLLRKYVDNECTKEELLQVHELLAKGVSDEVWQEVMNETVGRTDYTPLDTLHKDKLYRSIITSIEAAPGDSSTFPWGRTQGLLLRMAAVFLLMLGSGLAIYFFHYRPFSIEQIANLQHQHITIDDGSQIWINNKSKLTYPSKFDSDQRLVKLEGEAFFDVAKEPNRPFIIHTQGVRIQVLGTSFNVKSYDEEDEIVISLATGRIEVDAFGKRQILTPGDQLHYDKATNSCQRQRIDVAEASAWKEGWMVFNSTSLRDVVKTAERQYGIHVFMKEGIAAERKITLKVKQRGVDSLFQVLSYSTGLMYQIKGDSVILEPKHN